MDDLHPLAQQYYVSILVLMEDSQRADVSGPGGSACGYVSILVLMEDSQRGIASPRYPAAPDRVSILVLMEDSQREPDHPAEHIGEAAFQSLF